MSTSFNVSQFTSAQLKMDAEIEYKGKTASEVFDIMGDPEQITQFFP